MASVLISRLVLRLKDPKYLYGTVDSNMSRMVFAHRSHRPTNQTQSSASKSRTTASTSGPTESNSNYDGDEHETRSRCGLREVEDRIVEESSERQLIVLAPLKPQAHSVRSQRGGN